MATMKDIFGYEGFKSDFKVDDIFYKNDELPETLWNAPVRNWWVSSIYENTITVWLDYEQLYKDAADYLEDMRDAFNEFVDFVNERQGL